MRFLLLTLIACQCAFSQGLPAFQWIKQVDGSGSDKLVGSGIDAAGNIYLAGTTNSPDFPVKSAIQNHLAAAKGTNVFVTKLDPSGNIVYSTYFGGSVSDTANAMTVDPSGNVYVAGSAQSPDFPTTPSAYDLKPGAGFVFRLNPDGSLGYSTYLPLVGSGAAGIAADATGALFVGGGVEGFGSAPTTPGSFMPISPIQPPPGGICVLVCPPATEVAGFLLKLDFSAANLLFGTYLPADATALALAADGSPYISQGGGIYHLDAAGSTLLGSFTGGPQDTIYTLAISTGGYVYAGGSTFAPSQFVASANAFQSQPVPAPVLPSGSGGGSYAYVIDLNSALTTAFSATLLGGFYGDTPYGISFDAAGNVIVGGETNPKGFPTRTPLASSFGPISGFVAQLDSNLSHLLFSTYLGDTDPFVDQSVAVAPDGGIVIAGSTQPSYQSGLPSKVFVNKLTLASPPPLRIDSILNDASQLSVPLSPGETISVRGAGFGAGAQLFLGSTSIPILSMNASSITAVVPTTTPLGVALVSVQSAGGTSNVVEAPVVTAAPGLFSVDSTGYGQGFILNADGTLNSAENPAVPGTPITIFATGVGPLSSNGSGLAPLVAIDGNIMPPGPSSFGPVLGLPGNVYQVTANVPTSTGTLVQLSVVLEINGVSSQGGLAVSIVPPGGL